MKALEYHYRKLRYHRQSLNSLYSLDKYYKVITKVNYKACVQKERQSIKMHINIIREVREYMRGETITEEQEQEYEQWLLDNWLDIER